MIAQRHKVCCDCRENKPWSEYYVRTRWEDGGVRNVQARCKTCTARHRDEWAARKPDLVRACDAAYRKRCSSDPERLAVLASQARDRYRAKHNVPPERWRPKRYMKPGESAPELLPVEPFAEWLQHLIDYERETITAVAKLLDISEKTARAALKCERPTVELATVERALGAYGGVTLRELYPTIYEAVG